MEQMEVLIIKKQQYIKKNKKLSFANKIIYMYAPIICDEGTLIIRNCKIIYGKGIGENAAIVAKTGSKVEISDCTIEERGYHHDSVFLMAGHEFLFYNQETGYNGFRGNLPAFKMKQDILDYFNSDFMDVSKAYRTLENEKFCDDNLKYSMDDIVISNCTFTNKAGLFSKIIKPCNRGLNRPYIELECGGIVENCTFNIDSRCIYGIVKGTHNPKSYIKGYDARYLDYLDASEGEDADYEGLVNLKDFVGYNVNNDEKYRQTKVINCTFNKSYIGVFGNCIVKDSTFNKNTVGVFDSYNISGCTFDGCKQSIVRNTEINKDDAEYGNEFKNCNLRVFNRINRSSKVLKAIRRKTLLELLIGLAMLFMAGRFLIVTRLHRFNYDRFISNNIKFDMANSTVLFGLIFITVILIFLDKFINKLKTGELTHNFLGFNRFLLESAILIYLLFIPLSYYGNGYLEMREEGVLTINTDDYKFYVYYIDENKEKSEITKEEAENYIIKDKEDKLRYMLVANGERFNIDKNTYFENVDYEGIINIEYYNVPFKLLSVEGSGK